MKLLIRDRITLGMLAITPEQIILIGSFESPYSRSWKLSVSLRIFYFDNGAGFDIKIHTFENAALRFVGGGEGALELIRL